MHELLLLLLAWFDMPFQEFFIYRQDLLLI